MKVLVTGSRGLLGSCLVKNLRRHGIIVLEADLPEYNITSYNSMQKIFKKPTKIDFLINCAAYTNVPGAEKEKKEAYFLNAQALGVLAKICLENNTHLIHFSTDFVFDGKRKQSYSERMKTNPLNYYGESKLAGEEIIKRNMVNQYTIFRLQWLYGHNSKTFFSKILEKAKEGVDLKIVDDEYGSPCSVYFVSDVVRECISRKKFFKFKGKIFHLTHNDSCSRYECGKYFLKKLGYTNISAIRDIPSNIERPKFGVMDNRKLSVTLNYDLGSWKKDLSNFVDSIRKEEIKEKRKEVRPYVQ